ncbi:MAG: HNH endonuclease, partial [Mollicutes bacterium]|nr:HNH endonuclease [Mollicutes bacterium]
VTKKSGIYEYILTRDEKYLNIRVFDDNMKREAFERQTGICVKCEEQFSIEEMAGDHIIPWSKGGKTTAENCQMLCTRCNAIKSNK